MLWGVRGGFVLTLPAKADRTAAKYLLGTKSILWRIHHWRNLLHWNMKIRLCFCPKTRTVWGRLTLSFIHIFKSIQGLELDDLKGPFQTKLSYNSLVYGNWSLVTSKKKKNTKFSIGFGDMKIQWWNLPAERHFPMLSGCWELRSQAHMQSQYGPERASSTQWGRNHTGDTRKLVQNKTLPEKWPWTKQPWAISDGNKANNQIKQRNIPTDLSSLSKQTKKLRFQRAGSSVMKRGFGTKGSLKPPLAIRHRRGRSHRLSGCASHTHMDCSINICPGMIGGGKFLIERSA